ncbi:hypothetical protein VTJ04DRAFT_90 [Mycothermus thermophilus]|uniref:uncharacterized protein n=1 Tax=Humicola insolens TaxID=85995 RepID=UPI0037426F88
MRRLLVWVMSKTEPVMPCNPNPEDKLRKGTGSLKTCPPYPLRPPSCNAPSSKTMIASPTSQTHNHLGHEPRHLQTSEAPGQEDIKIKLKLIECTPQQDQSVVVNPKAVRPVFTRAPFPSVLFEQS